MYLLGGKLSTELAYMFNWCPSGTVFTISLWPSMIEELTIDLAQGLPPTDYLRRLSSLRKPSRESRAWTACKADDTRHR